MYSAVTCHAGAAALRPRQAACPTQGDLKRRHRLKTDVASVLKWTFCERLETDVAEAVSSDETAWKRTCKATRLPGNGR